MTSEVVSGVIDVSQRFASPHGGVILFPIDGEHQHLPSDHSAVGNRDAGVVLNISASWERAEDDDANIEWARAGWRHMRHLSTGGTYVNFLNAEEGDDRIRAIRTAPTSSGWDASSGPGIRTTCSGSTRTSRRAPDSSTGPERPERLDSVRGPRQSRALDQTARDPMTVEAPISRRERMRQSVGPFRAFFEGAYARLDGQADVANFAVGNPHEMALPGLVSALRDHVEPRDPDWFGYKLSEPEAQRTVAATLTRRTGMDWDPADVAMTNGGFAAICGRPADAARAG